MYTLVFMSKWVDASALLFWQRISTWDVLGVRWGRANGMDCNWFHALTSSVSSTDSLICNEYERNVKHAVDSGKNINFYVIILVKIYECDRLQWMVVENLIVVSI